MDRDSLRCSRSWATARASSVWAIGKVRWTTPSSKDRFASNPASLSVPIASPPFPPRGQLFHFRLGESSERRWFFTVIFRCSQDETALHVLSVTWREVTDT